MDGTDVRVVSEAEPVHVARRIVTPPVSLYQIARVDGHLEGRKLAGLRP